MEREDFTKLEQLLENLVGAVTYVEGMTFDEFIANEEKQQSVARRLELAFDASSRLSEGIRALFPEIPWEEVEDLRKELERQRFELDDAFLWDVGTHDAVYLVFLVRDALEMLYSRE